MKKIIFIILISNYSLLIVNAQTGWFQQNSGTNALLRSVYFADENTGYAAGAVSLKTTNGGTTWSTMVSGPGGFCVFFVNSVTGFIGSTNRIYKTTDGGLNWAYATVSYQPVFSIYFVNSLTGLAAMGFQFSGNIAKTTNGGENWFNTAPVQGYLSVHFANASVGYALASYGQIYKTLDGGFNWSYISEGAWGSSSICAADTNTVYASFRYGRVRKTTDGGLNWSVLQSPTNIDLYSVFFTNTNTGYAVGGYSGQAIVSTRNGGANWDVQSSATSITLWNVYFINSNTGWAVGDSGLILKTTTGGLTAINPPNKELPVSYHLQQNYPNPFNPVTRIRFDIPVASVPRTDIRLIIYDILGRQIATLVNEILAPETYELEWNASGFPSGIYFYTLTSGEFSGTKKMILMK